MHTNILTIEIIFSHQNQKMAEKVCVNTAPFSALSKVIAQIFTGSSVLSDIAVL